MELSPLAYTRLKSIEQGLWAFTGYIGFFHQDVSEKVPPTPMAAYTF